MQIIIYENRHKFLHSNLSGSDKIWKKNVEEWQNKLLRNFSNIFSWNIIKEMN